MKVEGEKCEGFNEAEGYEAEAVALGLGNG